MKTKVMLAVATALAVACSAWFSGGADIVQPAYRPPTATNVYRALVDDAYDAGFMLGWACRNRGGTKADAELLMNAHRSNDINVVNRWFDSH